MVSLQQYCACWETQIYKLEGSGSLPSSKIFASNERLDGTLETFTVGLLILSGSIREKKSNQTATNTVISISNSYSTYTFELLSEALYVLLYLIIS